MAENGRVPEVEARRVIQMIVRWGVSHPDGIAGRDRSSAHDHSLAPHDTWGSRAQRELER